MTRIHEIQEFEAWVRSTLVWFGVREDLIDGLIKDDVYIQHMKEMEARAELLLEHAFRRNDMDGQGQGGQVPGKAPKAFATIVDNLTACSCKAATLSKRSSGLVSLIIGESKPQIEKDCEETKPSVVLIKVLSDTIIKISKNLNEISNNLEKLEKAW